MNNIEFLLEGIEAKCNKQNTSYKIDKIIIEGKFFNSKSLFIIMEHFKWLIDLKIKRKVKILINCDVIGDDASLIILETLIYYMIKNYDTNVEYTFNVRRNSIGYELYKLSNLYEFDNKKIDKIKFLKNFENKFILNMHHFKKICFNTLENREGEYLSNLYTDICEFLKNNLIKKDYYEMVGETISEILSNVMSHSDADSILEIKTGKGYRFGKECKFLNITIISYTKVRFGEKLKDYLKNPEGYNESNKIVDIAYNIQKEKFNNNDYTLDNFVMISSFQRKVTTRKDSFGTGGTGLTTLIDTLLNSTLDDYCYILNGNSTLYFRKPYLRLNADGSIGFNDSNDYINEIPSDKIFNNSKNCFNGTVHHFSLILEGEDYE